jgi:hypothetical protein
MSGRDVLSAIPVAASGTSLEVLPSGGGVLTRRAPAVKGVRAWLARSLHFQQQRRFELDEVGACFWCQVDGERPLSEIHGTLCRRYGLSSEQARRAIVEFTAVLLRRNLLALRLEDT